MEVLIQLNAVLVRYHFGNAHMGMLLTGRMMSVLVHLQKDVHMYVSKDCVKKSILSKDFHILTKI